MADVDSSNNQSLAKDYLLEEKLQQVQEVAKSVEESVVKPAAETAGEIVQKAEEAIGVADSKDASDSVEKAADSTDSDAGENKDIAPDESSEPENTVGEEAEEAEEAPQIKLETAPADVRFPTTNQTRHCFTRYIEYHRCVAAKGEGAPECDKFAKYYRSLCPGEWVERWNEQRENGTFPGPL
ncbi:cytochrome c oxidase subunit 6b-1-like [Andrographis paniculata]|uniref:cytochrome c oxidase subunit 6b-1-like n=1 Tax=Andrographis paniculata TaxID=175694 RepID=UPI0021E7F906|nr:cytochrome c oxidase subunit 6b-1-like [Andrographis paniculata]